jgi:hypothetical protein
MKIISPKNMSYLLFETFTRENQEFTLFIIRKEIPNKLWSKVFKILIQIIEIVQIKWMSM